MDYFLKVADLDKALNLVSLPSIDVTLFHVLNVEEFLPCGDVVFSEYILRDEFWSVWYSDKDIEEDGFYCDILFNWVLRSVSSIELDTDAFYYGWEDDEEITYLTIPSKYEHYENYFDKRLVA